MNSSWEGLVHPRHRKKYVGRGQGGGVSEFGKIRAPQTQKKYVGERREGGGVGDKRRRSGKKRGLAGDLGKQGY